MARFHRITKYDSRFRSTLEIIFILFLKPKTDLTSFKIKVALEAFLKYLGQTDRDAKKMGPAIICTG